MFLQYINSSVILITFLHIFFAVISDIDLCFQVALKFQIQRGIAVIPKSSNDDRLKENLEVKILK